MFRRRPRPKPDVAALAHPVPGRGMVRMTLGPALVAAVAYIDPGNVATNTSAGALYGYALLWVVLAATAVAGVVQYLAGKVGLVSGGSLAAYVAGRTGTTGRLAYWVQAELVIIATDIAEVVGAAAGLYLLFGIPPVVGGVVAGVLGMAILALRDILGAWVLEWTSMGALLLVGAGFVVGLVGAPPNVVHLVHGVIPSLPGPEAVLLAAGIVGATIMPHAVYVHSGLAAEHARSHPGALDLAAVKGMLSANRRAVATAMVVAGAINVTMLVLGASALQGIDGEDFAGFTTGLAARVGDGAATGFAVALLVSGLASTGVGTYAGDIITADLIRYRVAPLLRRLGTLVPAVLVLALAQDIVGALVLSQTVLALGLPFVLVPLVLASRDPAVMGEARNQRATTVVAVVATAAVIALDLGVVWWALTA